MGTRKVYSSRALSVAAVVVAIGLAVPTTAVGARGALPAPSRAVAQAQVAATDFSTSFETADPAPTYVDTVETDALGNKEASGITGSLSTRPLGSIYAHVVLATTNFNNPPSEIVQNLNDGDVNTKWLGRANANVWVQYQLDTPITVVKYTLSSANDSPTRDPKNFTLQGSQNGTDWTVIDTETNQTWTGRFTTNTYASFTNTTAYLYYRIYITANNGDSYIQLSEWDNSNGDTTPLPLTDMKSQIGNGPVSVYTAKSTVGWTGLKALRYGGGSIDAGHDWSYNKIYDVNIPVTSATQLSYMIFPEFTGSVYQRPSTYAAVDLAFDDGTYLRDLGAVDQHGFGLNAKLQGLSKSLYANQWNAISSNIGAVAAGKTIVRILVDYDNPNIAAALPFQGWIDDLKIVGTYVAPTITHLSDWVRHAPRHQRQRHVLARQQPADDRGAARLQLLDAGDGRRLDLLGVPLPGRQQRQQPAHDAGVQRSATSRARGWATGRCSRSCRRRWQRRPAAAPRVRLSSATRARRRKPYYYGVTFTNGMKTEIAPRPRGDLPVHLHRRHIEPDPRQRHQQQRGDDAQPSTGATILTGYQRSGGTGTSRMFWYGTFDVPVTASGTPATTGGGSNVTRYVTFDTSVNKVVTLRIATSLLGTAQAQHNYDLEIGAGMTFESVRDAGQAAWDDILDVVEVEGAHARPDDHLLLEPLPPQPVPELGAREHRYERDVPSGCTPSSRATSSPSGTRRPPPAPRSSTERSTSTTASGTRTARPGPASRSSTRPRPARWSTGSSSSTRTVAGSPAGRHPATPT